MNRFRARLLVAAALLCLPSLAVSQQRPSTEQAEQMLQDPRLLGQLRERIMSSGLTPDQIRARLRAEGYPESLLDAYFGAGGPSDTLPVSSDVFAAASRLGLADSIDVILLECGIDPDTVGLGLDLTPLGQRGQTAAGQPTAGGRAAVRTDSAGGLVDAGFRKRQLAALCRSTLDTVALRSRLAVSNPDSGYQVFGTETFRRGTTLFDANITGPVDANYRIGPGDQLVLVLTGDVEASHQLPVTREGFVLIPQVGQVFVNNLTLAELEDVLYSRLGRVYSGVRRGPGASTRFSISPARLRSNQIFVHGEVIRPGSHRVSSAGTAMTALYAAGGPTDNGSFRSVEIRRGGRLVEALDVYDYLLRGDASRDVRLQNGDVVFVPVHGAHARIIGEISRPATYELTEGETLADAIRFAGGFKPTANRERVQIERILPPSERSDGRDRIVTDVISPAFATGTGPNVPVLAGDVIRVFPVGARVRNRVSVSGAVWLPGMQGIAPGATQLSDVIRAAGGLKPDAYLGQILVSRLRPDSTRIQLRAALRDTNGTVVGDFPVQEDDEITVFSVSEFREPRYVAITGAVRKSGRFPFREGMTIRDLVLHAGGLEESALLNEAEVARLPEDRTRGQTARTFRVPLDSSYIFERGPDGRYLGPPGLPAPRGNAPDVVLSPYDNVLILRQPNFELQRTVAVEGEVRFPGRYALETKSERISDIIRRAGGVSREGFAEGTTFHRSKDRVGRIGLDVPGVLRSQRHRDNLVLQDGDSIFVPRFNGVVEVTGAVNSPVAVAYAPGQKIDYYVQAAGGLAVRGDLSRAYVTQANGKVQAVVKRPFAPDAEPTPGPGSVVHVPERDPSDRGVTLTALIGTLASVISTLVATVAIIKSL